MKKIKLLAGAALIVLAIAQTSYPVEASYNKVKTAREVKSSIEILKPLTENIKIVAITALERLKESAASMPDDLDEGFTVEAVTMTGEPEEVVDEKFTVDLNRYGVWRTPSDLQLLKTGAPEDLYEFTYDPKLGWLISDKLLAELEDRLVTPAYSSATHMGRIPLKDITELIYDDFLNNLGTEVYNVEMYYSDDPLLRFESDMFSFENGRMYDDGVWRGDLVNKESGNVLEQWLWPDFNINQQISNEFSIMRDDQIADGGEFIMFHPEYPEAVGIIVESLEMYLDDTLERFRIRVVNDHIVFDIYLKESWVYGMSLHEDGWQGLIYDEEKGTGYVRWNAPSQCDFWWENEKLAEDIDKRLN